MKSERAREQLRQERETFEQMRREGARWSMLCLSMGYGGLGLMAGIAVVAGVVVLHPGHYGPIPVCAAATTLLVDMLSLATSIARLGPSGSSVMVLEPITRDAVGDDRQVSPR